MTCRDDRRCPASRMSARMTRVMANGVREAIDAYLMPLGLSVKDLKREGLYLEDAY